MKKDEFRVELNEKSKVNKVIGVVSGKGGVGKSLVTSLLASTARKKGHKVGILDADITGPSIPKIFGLTEKAFGTKEGIVPIKSGEGIDIMSINLILEDETDPVVWRGSMISNAVKQFWTDVIWDDLDYMFIDMPPGTGDVPLTVFQSLDIDGIVVVTSPQELVSMVVVKAVKMAEAMDIPIIGVVENMSYFKCPDNNKKYKIFGESHIEDISEEHDIDILGRIPIDPEIANYCDQGKVEDLEIDLLEDAIEKMEEI